MLKLNMSKAGKGYLAVGIKDEQTGKFKNQFVLDASNIKLIDTVTGKEVSAEDQCSKTVMVVGGELKVVVTQSFKFQNRAPASVPASVPENKGSSKKADAPVDDVAVANKH